MIRKKEVFSKDPQGMIWLCSTCDQVHLWYGSVTVALHPDWYENLIWNSLEPMGGFAVCENCGVVHLDCGIATLHMPPQHYEQFLLAVRRFFLNMEEEALESYRDTPFWD